MYYNIVCMFIFFRSEVLVDRKGRGTKERDMNACLLF